MQNDSSDSSNSSNSNVSERHDVDADERGISPERARLFEKFGKVDDLEERLSAMRDNKQRLHELPNLNPAGWRLLDNYEETENKVREQERRAEVLLEAIRKATPLSLSVLHSLIAYHQSYHLSSIASMLRAAREKM